MTTESRAERWGAIAAPIALAVLVAIVLLLLAGANPFEAFKLIGEGAFSGWANMGETLMAWVPLVLASAGLIITFNAGLWNIGIEGQIILGGIAASWAAREVGGPGWVVVPAAIIAGALGGMVWALFAGVLKTRFKVNEIFGGLGLDFVAASLAVYLVIGPWKREGVASTSGTDLFRDEALLPTVAENNRLSLVAIGLAIAGVIFVYYLMKGTMFGLRLKAVGRNVRSAFLLGIPTSRYMLGAFALCGVLAGIAGSMQAIGFHFKLIPAISGGYGFLGILVVLLAAFRAAWIAPIALFFIAMSRGSTQLALRLDIDSALGGVITGILVLLVILGGGWQARRLLRREAAS
ncbi:MAG: ABC transporter permease [Acidimicrobiia bacterium]|nr:ABC transporter permease [Acidimicrobiia bacterium]MDH3470324.1 ABC transporter permease [Acidimicrobiia bacterium]